MERIAVLGAAGAVGGALVRCLAAEGRRGVIAVSRRPNAAFPEGVTVRAADVFDAPSLLAAFAGVHTVALVPGLSLSGRALPALHANGVRRVLAISSHNLSLEEAGASYGPIAAAEAAVIASGLAWTVLRPTLVYGHPELAAGASLIRLARRLPVMITPGLGLAWQQPIFYEDLARIAAWAIQDEAAVNRVIAVGGPEVVRLRRLYAEASRAAGRSGFVVPAPVGVLRFAARRYGDRFPLSEEQIARVRANKHVGEALALPAAVRPRVRLREGLARLAAAFPEEAGRP